MQDVEALEVGAGFSSAELGVQTRYEFTRQFAPYVDLKYERKLGETADLNDGADDNFIISLGIRLLL
jgi:copper resistance protein B